jgi:hypothetical protein
MRLKVGGMHTYLPLGGVLEVVLECRHVAIAIAVHLVELHPRNPLQQEQQLLLVPTLTSI